MKGVIWLDKKVLNNTSNIDKHLLPPIKISSDVVAKFKRKNLKINRGIRLSRIVSETFNLVFDNVRWFVIGDDDIYFVYSGKFSKGFIEALGKIHDECIRRYHYLIYSDERVHACMSELGVPLTKEPRVSSDKVEPIFPKMSRFEALQKLQIPAKLDSAALMQQSICYDKANSWTLSVSWGYVVQIVGGIVSARQMEMPARTFLDWDMKVDEKEFTFNTKSTISEYLLQHPIPEPGCQWKMPNPSWIDRIQVYKTPDPYLWDKAPRRNCCRVMQTKKKRTMVIDVGPCREDENIHV
ncbi:hypothetical protein ACFE04_026641 [Oxalis oulophora]